MLSHSPRPLDSLCYHAAVLCQMLVDLGCRDFMNSEMGLGVFVARAATPEGVNKIMLHQAANDGFRGV